jgi:hypothetical protein
MEESQFGMVSVDYECLSQVRLRLGRQDGWEGPLDLCRINGGDRPLLTSPQRSVL